MAIQERTRSATSEQFELLWLCFITGQMSERQMQAHLGEDRLFRSYVESRLAAHDSQDPQANDTKLSSRFEPEAEPEPELELAL